MIFRKARIQDISALNKISVAAKSYWGYPQDWIEHWLQDMLLSEKSLSEFDILVLELEGQIIGFCAIADEGDIYDISHLWISPDFIRKSYGKHLLEKAIESFCKEIKPLQVESDPHAESFYQKQGFVTIDQIESYPRGRFLPVMRRERN